MSSSESVQTVGGDQREVAAAWLASGKPPGMCPLTATAGHKVKQATLEITPVPSIPRKTLPKHQAISQLEKP
jgi:hypothetical protein